MSEGERAKVLYAIEDLLKYVPIGGPAGLDVGTRGELRNLYFKMTGMRLPKAAAEDEQPKEGPGRSEVETMVEDVR